VSPARRPPRRDAPGARTDRARSVHDDNPPVSPSASTPPAARPRRPAAARLAAGAAPVARAPARRRLNTLRSVATVLVADTVVTALIVALHHNRPLPTFVYAQSVGLLALLCVLAGRRLFFGAERAGWHRRPAGVALVAASCAIGYVGGTTLGDLYAGRSTWDDFRRHPDWIAGDVGISALFSVLVVGWFYLRGAAALQRERLTAIAHEATLARLGLLQSQLEPHMLFNTLANLRALIAADPPRAQEMLDRLIDFLGATLAASRSAAHPLADEFARIEDYLALMKVRMGERLRTRVELPPALAALPVPPLLLQPLVENAIRHGLEPQRGAGELAVSAALDGATLVLVVSDTGRGLAAAAAAPARDAADGPHPGGFGTDQVRDRLRTLHGDAASFTLAPRPEGGTRAEIRLPLAAPGSLPAARCPPP
jgi:signal transduction histidine kinase